ncbi:dihydroxyacetone kinase [Corynebacterium kroppenstedtii DSM 44385]|uniref:Phosphocarrier protein HPr n=2 Tax=Corynebacterium kroppenstedtii TaxID=161879 RepID=C4LG94_CORK4|nr:dihydroxyacetone kinase [Corynebacterium kroppenstedtii DSM 44385]
MSEVLQRLEEEARKPRAVAGDAAAATASTATAGETAADSSADEAARSSADSSANRTTTEGTLTEDGLTEGTMMTSNNDAASGANEGSEQSPQVGVVVVSHSKRLADGLALLASQMAKDVLIVPAGGLDAGPEDKDNPDGGGIGTSYDAIEAAVNKVVDAGLACAIFTDLGSATMTVEMVVDMLDDEPVRFIDAPLVEATVAGAVAAQQGQDLDGVEREARRAISAFESESAGGDSAAAPGEDAAGDSTNSDDANGGGYSRRVKVADKAGLHARPAAKLAEMAADSEEGILVNDADADSAMSLMGLGAECGEEVTVSGDRSEKALIDSIADAIAAGLDE